MKWLWRRRWWCVAAIALVLSSVVYLRSRPPRVQFVCFREERGQRMAVFMLENPGSLTYGYNEAEKATPPFQLKRPNGWEMKPASGWVSFSGIIYTYGRLHLAPGEREEFLVPLICSDKTPVTVPFRVGVEFYVPPSNWHHKLPTFIQQFLPSELSRGQSKTAWSNEVIP